MVSMMVIDFNCNDDGTADNSGDERNGNNADDGD